MAHHPPSLLSSTEAVQTSKQDTNLPMSGTVTENGHRFHINRSINQLNPFQTFSISNKPPPPSHDGLA
ncbi:hypothetical protein L873DRAFT_1802549 [Choiromyces venosus 120613-1]|uniref:Uncharacterized protein n=1 Tax=Choiromyces venosus 120613-1 TaxID=1336337 RepID=A0A3N4JUS4_9PEZI|nr:hypothetical protein L873DRAFT_1802549 [Choiromyces venosus 120613-1]